MFPLPFQFAAWSDLAAHTRAVTIQDVSDEAKRLQQLEEGKRPQLDAAAMKPRFGGLQAS